LSQNLLISAKLSHTTRECVHIVTLMWPWPWPRDLNTRPWSKCSHACQKWSL